jgi:cellobiose epimerase
MKNYRAFAKCLLITGGLGMTVLITGLISGCRGFHASSVEGMPSTQSHYTAGSFSRDERKKLATAMEENLSKHVLLPWGSRAVDRERGGFHQTYAEDWKEKPDSARSVVYQSRLTWVFAKALRQAPKDDKQQWGIRMRHGLDYLAGPMWDAEHGGWYWEIGAESKRPDSTRGTEKHAYGISFGIYASATVYRTTKEGRALKLAQDGFKWLDTAAHDQKNGGYFEALSRDGKPLMQAPQGQSRDAIGTRYGLKSMNTHIHLLEAFTALYDVWPDKTLRTRLEEVFRIVRDRIAATNGYLYLFFTPDWTPVPDHDSFGHDVETAFLLAEAAYALGIPENKQTWTVARRLIDHALRFGWDEKHGGFFDAGEPDGKVTNTKKIWWTQAEGLNALLLMDEQCGRDDSRYRDAFLKQWKFIEKFQTDARNRGWHSEVFAEGAARPGQNKSDAWKDPYHQGRALMRCLEVLWH